MFKKAVTKGKAVGFNARYLSSPGGADSTGGDPRFKGAEGPTEHSCGIPPWKIAHLIPPPPPPPEFPSHLIRPPCLPGSTLGGYQTCVKGNEGFYCVPCRLKYKYPPFSENIDFVPPYMMDPPCWWKRGPSCYERGDAENKVLDAITKRWPCNYDDGGAAE